MNFENLTEEVRYLMVDEIEMDISQEKLYPSPRLTSAGILQYPNLLIQVATQADPNWLEGRLNMLGLIKAKEQRRSRNGNVSMVKVPHTAAKTLAEGEFNYYYVRGLCAYAIQNEIEALQVYRAKAVRNPRSSSMAKIGMLLPSNQLLADLRLNHLDAVLGIPAGPNSGLSVRIPVGA